MKRPRTLPRLALVLALMLAALVGCERADEPAKSEPAAPADPGPSEAPATAPVADTLAEQPQAPLQIANPKDYAHPESVALGTLPEGVGLAPGSTVPDFEAVDALGQTRSRDALVAEGPLLVVFYRGGW